MRESFVFYKSFFESIKELDPKDQVQIYNAIFEYEFYKNEPELSGVCKSIFTLILPQLEANNKKYENGKKGGRPKNQNKTKTKPKQNQNKTKPEPNVNDNDNVNDNKKENNKKKKFGEFNNVLLTEEEYTKLENNNLLFYIEKLSAYLESTGKRYKSHYATILNWSRKEKQDNNKNEETKLTKVGNGAFIIGG